MKTRNASFKMDMPERNIGREVLQGIGEIKAHKAGKTALRTHELADPIVKEIREAGARLAAKAGNDVHRFFENLRKAGRRYGKPLVQKPVPSDTPKTVPGP